MLRRKSGKRLLGLWDRSGLGDVLLNSIMFSLLSVFLREGGSDHLTCAPLLSPMCLTHQEMNEFNL